MSSTNRSSSRDTHVSDYYVTPVPAIACFLNKFLTIEPMSFHNVNILDPCAGGDTCHGMSYPSAFKIIGSKNKIDTLDIRDNSLADLKTNYLLWKPEKIYNVIITNPPFNLALEIIQKALSDVSDNGWVIMLLRLNFFESKKRKSFFDEHMPFYTFVHHERMSFMDNGTTDSIAYMHACWSKNIKPEFTKLYII